MSANQQIAGVSTIVKLYVDDQYCHIELKAPLEAGVMPSDHYFVLSRDKNNYESIFALAMTALANGLRVEVRTTAPIDPTKPSRGAKLPQDAGNGVVSYFVAWAK